MEIRSFLAFELPGEIKEILIRVSAEMRKSSLDVRWANIESIHLTLVFLGNIMEDRLDAVGEEVGELCGEYGPFRVFLKAVGVFPHRRNPNVLWAGLDGDLERMARFRDGLEQGLKPFGIKEERRPFKPHLTLARFRKGAGTGAQPDALLTAYQGLQSPVCTLSALNLFKSDLRPTGAVYTKLKTWPLAGRR